MSRAARLPPALATYAWATRLLQPLAPALLARRARRGKEAANRLSERLGRASRPRPAGPLAWLHGVSVGESISLLPLADALTAARPDLNLLVTSGTATSAEVMARRLPAGVIHQFAPVDTPAAVERFLDHWRPDMALFAESELWPNLILGAERRGVRLALISARITQKSASGWARTPVSAHRLMQAFDLVLPQDEASGERLRGLGAQVGRRLNLKLAGEAPPCDRAELERLQSLLAGRRIVLAASTHAGEEALVGQALRTLDLPGVLLIVAPRHPDRGSDAAQALAAAGWRVARRSGSQPVTAEIDAYVADTLGELGLFLRLAEIVVMGGSFFAGVGGHNPMEAARLGVGVLSGPHVENAAEIYAELAAAGGARLVEDGPQLARSVADLMGAPAQARALGLAGQAYATAQSEALVTALPAILALLPA